VPVLRFETYMYCVGKRSDGGGARISAAAYTAPGGGLAGMMDTLERMAAGPLMACVVSVEESSCSVNRRLSE
jgi:hypothetical protein